MTTADAIFILGLLFMAVALMVTAYAFKRQALAFGAIGGWLLLSVYAYTLSAATWDIFYTLFFICIGLTIVSALEAMMLRGGPEVSPDEKDSLDQYNEDMDKFNADMDRHRKMMGGDRERRRRGKGGSDTRLVP